LTSTNLKPLKHSTLPPLVLLLAVVTGSAERNNQIPATLRPSNPHESAILITLQPGKIPPSGPSLSGVVQGELADPILLLYNANGTALASNDNWKINDRSHASQEADVRDSGLPPANELESAIVTSVAPGNYTAGPGKKQHFRHRPD
jgi:hypothetical protein